MRYCTSRRPGSLLVLLFVVFGSLFLEQKLVLVPLRSVESVRGQEDHDDQHGSFLVSIDGTAH